MSDQDMTQPEAPRLEDFAPKCEHAEHHPWDGVRMGHYQTREGKWRCQPCPEPVAASGTPR